LADKMDAVLLVIRPRQSRRTLVKGMYEQLKRIDTDVLGIVVNGASKTFGEYEPYYEAYTHNSPPTKSKGKRTGTDRSSLQKMFAALTKKQTPSE
jgi:Mrp family chromosome partitioning ATPase